MAGGFSNSDTFKTLIILNSEYSQTANLICDFVKHGITKKIYKLRADILFHIFNSIDGIMSLNVETEIGALLPKLNLSYCAMEEIQCSQCLFQEANFLHSLELVISNATSLGETIKSLVNCESLNRLCNRSGCTGNLTKETEISPTHLFIQPVNIDKNIRNVLLTRQNPERNCYSRTNVYTTLCSRLYRAR